jgi:Flp pilus assembly pilin Flp
MNKYLLSFATDEDGAITVDWVVLTAAAVGLALFILGVIQTGALDTISQMWADIDAGIP